MSDYSLIELSPLIFASIFLIILILSLISKAKIIREGEGKIIKDLSGKIDREAIFSRIIEREVKE